MWHPDVHYNCITGVIRSVNTPLLVNKKGWLLIKLCWQSWRYFSDCVISI